MSNFQCFITDDPHHPRFKHLPYGPRIAVKIHAGYEASYCERDERETNLCKRLDDLCMWGGSDRLYQSEDGKSLIYSYEFPKLGEGEFLYDAGKRYAQALYALRRAGFGQVKKHGKRMKFHEGFK